MPREQLRYSMTQVRKAGKVLRDDWREPMTHPADRVEWAHEVLGNWRACHSQPLNKATTALRARLGTISAAGDVSQRLKRRATIIGKLARQPTMQLTTMQDIAGCRAIVASMEIVWRLQDGWRVERRLVRRDDYVTNPRPSGYRAVHLIVEYDDRQVEMQLRTQLQHEWAYSVEVIGGRIGHDLKSGEGPPEVLNLLEVIAEAMEYEEQSRELSDALLHELHEARYQARSYLERMR